MGMARRERGEAERISIESHRGRRGTERFALTLTLTSALTSSSTLFLASIKWRIYEFFFTFAANTSDFGTQEKKIPHHKAWHFGPEG